MNRVHPDRVAGRHVSALRLASLATLAVLAIPSTATAGPWGLPEGLFVLGVSGGAEFADEELLPDGTRQVFPLSGRFDSYHLDFEGRYGLSSVVEVGLKTQLKGVSYVSDPVLLAPGVDAPGLRDYRQNVLSFNTGAVGVGDIWATVVYNHLSGGVQLSSALELKVPTGYQAPRETFIDAVKRQDQLGDDVTLGDGKVALAYRLQAGSFIGATGTLLQADAGYLARFNGPGHQAVAEVKIGQTVDEHLVFFVGADGALTLFHGQSLGVGLTAIDPTVDALDFEVSNVREIQIRLDQDVLRAFGGAIVRFGGREVVLTASRVLWGANTPVFTGVFVGTVFAVE